MSSGGTNEINEHSLQKAASCSPRRKPLTARQTPSTPVMIRQSSTSFVRFAQRKTVAQHGQATCDEIICEIHDDEHKQADVHCTKHADSVSQKPPPSIHEQDDDAHSDQSSECSTSYNEDVGPESSPASSSAHDEAKQYIELKSDAQILHERGYQIVRKIADTSQGCVYEGIALDPLAKIKRVAIKMTQKLLFMKRISVQNDINVITNKNVIKEAIIMHHLTVDNVCTSDYLCQFVEFFEAQAAYFLVMEYVSDMSLKAFCDRAFEYIRQRKMELKDYKRICKYLFWQLVTAMHWMNHDMNACHLDLHVENILINTNAADIFVEDMETGKVRVNTAIHLKIIDFGLSEVFRSKETEQAFADENKDGDEGKQRENTTTSTILDTFAVFESDPLEVDWENVRENPFFCKKFAMQNHQYSSPKIWMEEPFDARKADAWSLGIVLFYLATGKVVQNPYVAADTKIDSGYWCLKHNNLRQYLEMNDLAAFVPNLLLSVLNGLLDMDESKRLSTGDVMHHRWLKNYLAKYQQRIEQKSLAQKERNKAQITKMKIFPFYNANATIIKSQF